MTILVIKFSFQDWETQTVNSFRENIISFIGIHNSRNVLLVSSELDQDGINFYLKTTDDQLASRVQKQFQMNLLSEPVNLKDFAIEFGNQDFV